MRNLSWEIIHSRVIRRLDTTGTSKLGDIRAEEDLSVLIQGIDIQTGQIHFSDCFLQVVESLRNAELICRCTKMSIEILSAMRVVKIAI